MKSITISVWGSFIVVVLGVVLAFPASAAEFVLGEHGALSGRYAKGGTSMHEGIAVAVKEFNRRKTGNTAKLITIDDQSDPAKAVAAVEELLSKGITTFVGGYGSNIVGPASELVIRAGGVYVTAGGTSRQLTERGYNRFFRLTSAEGYSGPWVSFLKEIKVKKVSILALKREATQLIARDIAERLRKGGIEVVVHDFDAGLEDFKPILNLVKLRDRSDAVVMSGYETDDLMLMRAAQVVRPDVKVIGGVIGWAYDEYVEKQGPLFRNTIGNGILPSPPRFDSEEGKRFLESYRETYNKPPDFAALWNYDVTMMTLDAMAKAQSAGRLDGETIAKFLRNDGKPRSALSTIIQFDEKGNNEAFSYRLVQHVENGLEVVWPRQDATTSKLTLPARSW